MRNQRLLETSPPLSLPMLPRRPPPAHHHAPRSPHPSAPPSTPSPGQCQPSCLARPIHRIPPPTKSSLVPSRVSSPRVAYPSRTGIMHRKMEARWVARSHPYQFPRRPASPNPRLRCTRRHQSRRRSYRAPRFSGPRTLCTPTSPQAAPPNHRTPTPRYPLLPPRLCLGSVDGSCLRHRALQHTLPRSCPRFGREQV